MNARALFLGALLALGACETTPPGPAAPGRVEISNEVETTAEVVALEPTARLLTLQHEDGHVFTVLADDDVRNLDEIAVGDRLRLRYREMLVASLDAAEEAGPVEGGFAAVRARPGDEPGLGLGLAVGMTVEIESIDLEADIVVFSLASGGLIAHRIATPEGRAFVRGLEVGDTVRLEYSEAMAISIEEL